MRRGTLSVLPAALFALGVGGAGLLQPATRLTLDRPLAELPRQLGPYEAVAERELGPGELAVLAPDDYVLRRYETPDGRGLELFASFYGRQIGGGSIHSPRNCLPGAGWEPVAHEHVQLDVDGYPDATINRYVIQDQAGRRALVFYWYQGRGRIAANEYRVKWDLLRDAVVMRRTDEAMVRVVFPLSASEQQADRLARSEAATQALRRLATAMQDHLPDA